MLTKLVILNFQSHAKLVLRLGRVTTLIGRTDAGKSAVVRALRFLALNRWKGVYQRHGTATTEVILYVDGRRVARRKGRGNTYHIGKHVYAAVGKAGVPPAVAALLNIDGDNFQLQLDPPFWFSDRASAVAKKLNKIVNLSAIDRTVGGAAKELKKADVEHKVARGRLTGARQTVKQLSWVPTVAARVDAVAAREAKARQFALNASGLKSLVREGSDLSGVKEGLQRAFNANWRAVRHRQRADRAAQTRRQLEELLTLVRTDRRNRDMPIPDVTQLLANRRRADAVAERRRNLEYLIRDLEAEKEKLCRLEEKIEQAKRRLGNRCPTCGAAIKKDGGGSVGTRDTTKCPHSEE